MPQLHEITVDACAAARATIRAAEIQAKAARSAGTETVFAGGFTFVASILAVIIAYVSASRDSRRVEKEREIINKAYRIALHALFFNALKEIEGLKHFLKRLSRNGQMINSRGSVILPNTLDLRSHRAICDALTLERSSDLSKLPNDAIKYAIASSLAIDNNLTIYSSIESFLPKDSKSDNSIDFREIYYYSEKYREKVLENEKLIKEFYNFLIDVTN
ncbi:MAG: hypothetical protein ABF746_08790 [Acetobacter orientalis]|uniref:hypothetical protein n=1 Tax=Acetobacter orientalis TaxID=146474 RepID=UPI0039E9DFC2